MCRYCGNPVATSAHLPVRLHTCIALNVQSEGGYICVDIEANSSVREW
jgi:hypothetical protein